MTRLAVAVVAALLLLPAASLADATTTRVAIEFNDYVPSRVDVLIGDTVSWSNVSQRRHTVTDDAGNFDSGVVFPGDGFRHVFASAGSFSYHCTLHPFIRGEVDVHSLLMDAPSAPAQGSQPFPLSGRAALPAGTLVTIQFDDGSDAGWRDVVETPVADGGAFSTEVTPTTSGSYRAVSGSESSPAVQLLVLNRSISARAVGRRVIAAVTPASPGATVVVQLHLKERFGWWPVAQRKLDRDSRATFTLRTKRRVAARVLLTLPDGATPLATSPTFRVGPVAH